MKKILLLLILIFVLSCNSNQKSESKKYTSESFDWLLGDWQRLYEEEGLITFEYWKKLSNTEYEGLGIRLQQTDTLFQENIKLVKSDKVWNLVVMTKEDSIPTIFKVTKIDSTSFTCENHLNEFPKTIQYYGKADKLKAVIAGDSLEIPFVFKRIR